MKLNSQLSTFVLFLFGFLISALNGNSQMPPSITEGLVSYYRMDGNANDETGVNSNGVTDFVTQATDRYGNEKSALFFDGTNSICKLEKILGIDLTNSFTITLWFRRWNTTQNQSQIISFSDSVNQTLAFIGLDKQNSIIFGYPTNSNGFAYLNGNSRLPSKWIHLSLVHNQNKYFRVYLNGAVIANTLLSQAFETPINGQIGITLGGIETNTKYKGYLDDIRIYNKALTEEDLFAVYTYEWTKPDSLFSIKAQHTFNGHTYLVSKSKLSIAQARAFAKYYSGYLAVPENEVENNFLMRISAFQDYWIGVYRGKEDGKGFFRANDGEPITWSRWHDNEPNNGIVPNWRKLPEEWYAETYGSTGTWNDVSDSYKTIELGGDLAIAEIDQEVDVILDKDSDGISDYRETTIYKTNPELLDTDGDGWSDGDEVNQNTNPIDRESRPESLLIQTAVELSFWTNKGLKYQLQKSDDLSNWIDAFEPISGIGGLITKLVSTKSEVATYWRISRIP
jgi:Concanavalin A-like lectin/glucanases superfamily/Bacterial TSP3 repeat/Lectin C-type domain